MRTQLRTRKGIFVVLMAAWAALTTMGSPAQAAKLFEMSEQEEIAAGQQVAVQAEKEYGGTLPDTDPMSVRVRSIGAQFAALATRKNIPYSYKVLKSDTVLNAFAAPGGPIYVTKKLVQTAESDAELAYVLGHETGHIEQKHIVNAVAKQQKAGLFVGLLGSLLGRGKNSNLVNLVLGGTFQVWQSGYSRDQERDADAVGARLMSRLGYDPNAAVSMLGKLGGGSKGIEKYLASHPNPQSRQANVTKQIAAENLLKIARDNGGPRLWQGDGPRVAATPTPAPVKEVTTPAAAPVAQELNLGKPLVISDQGNFRVIMAPVSGLAQWAGGEVRAEGDGYRAARGGNSIVLRRGSSAAVINGATITMSAPAAVYDGTLYAPVGSVVQGLGVRAELDQTNMAVWLTADAGQRGFVRLP